MRVVAIAVISAVLSATPVAAQIGNPGGMTAATPESAPGKPAPHQPNAQNRLFVYLIGTGGMAEVDLGKMAERKAGSDAVKNYARMLAQDHAKSNAELARLAKQSNVVLPPDLDPDYKALRSRLDTMSGAPFDVAYVQAQVVDHQQTAHLLEWEITSGQDADLQRYASASLPVVLQHLAMAQMLVAQLTGAGPQGLAAVAPAPSANAQARPQQ